MAFLGPPLRWPDALTPSNGPLTTEGLANTLREYLPDVLAGLPSPLLVSLTLSFLLLSTIFIFSASLNARRRSLVPAHTVSAPRRKAGQTTRALLVGPEQTGKSAIYSALVFEAVPETQTSQHENESQVKITSRASGIDEKETSAPVQLVDLPGHPRLRAKANDYLSVADKIIFCVDTSTAIRGGSSKNETLIEAVDQFHATLTSLARNRLSRTASKTALPPSLLVLFTRGDLSPLLAASPYDAKRQAQVVVRARTAFEAELGRRRAGMGLGRGAASQPRAKVASMSKVTGGAGSAGGWFGSLKALLGLNGGSGGSKTGDEDEDEGDEDTEGLDYVDWAWSQRSAGGQMSDSGATTGFSLDKLDTDVIMGGKATFAVASLGKERGWVPTDDGESDAPYPGLRDLRAWLVDPEA